MNRLKRILSLGLMSSIVGLAGIHPLAAADPKNEQANWNNLKGLNQGQEIKVVLNDAKAYRGLFQSVSDDGIGVALATGNATFGRQDILRVSTKAKGHRLRNTGLGAAIGGGSLAAVGAACCQSGGTSYERNYDRGFRVVGGPIAGSLIGAAVGAVIPTEGWQDVYRAL